MSLSASPPARPAKISLATVWFSATPGRKECQHDILIIRRGAGEEIDGVGEPLASSCFRYSLMAMKAAPPARTSWLRLP